MLRKIPTQQLTSVLSPPSRSFPHLCLPRKSSHCPRIPGSFSRAFVFPTILLLHRRQEKKSLSARPLKDKAGFSLNRLWNFTVSFMDGKTENTHPILASQNLAKLVSRQQTQKTSNLFPPILFSVPPPSLTNPFILPPASWHPLPNPESARLSKRGKLKR